TAQRSYEVDVPARAERASALPVVLVFHGGGGSADSVRRQTRMSAKGAAEGFIAVYPQGSGGIAGRLRTWNAGTCCGRAMQQRVDEVAFVGALLDDLQATVAIDLARVYATGISNGGLMAYEVACALADRVAAIAVVAGEMTALDRCRPSRPVPSSSSTAVPIATCRSTVASASRRSPCTRCAAWPRPSSSGAGTTVAARARAASSTARCAGRAIRRAAQAAKSSSSRSRAAATRGPAATVSPAFPTRHLRRSMPPPSSG